MKKNKILAVAAISIIAVQSAALVKDQSAIKNQQVKIAEIKKEQTELPFKFVDVYKKGGSYDVTVIPKSPRQRLVCQQGKQAAGFEFFTEKIKNEKAFNVLDVKSLNN